MISSGVLAAMVFTLAVSVLAPIILAIVFYRRQRYRISFLFIGALVFFVSQIVLRIPLLSVLSMSSWHVNMMQSLVYAVLIGGLTAGLFEEGGRWAAFRLARKKEPGWSDAVAFGIGHGGIEAILLVGLAQVNNLIVSLIINSGAFASQIAPIIGDEADLLLDMMLELTPGVVAMGAVERLAVIPIHIFWSVLVCLAVIKRKPVLVLATILMHTLVNGIAVVGMMQGWSIYLIEAILIVFGALSLWGIIYAKKYFPKKVEESKIDN